MLENEYFNEKQLLENAQARLKEMEELDVENMTQEQLEARERVIKGAKEDIKESEELLSEIEEELVEFINNGGEVSEKTKEAINYFEQIRVDFKIVSNRNEEVYTEGYVEINDAEAEDVDWYYYDAQGIPTSQMFIEHDGVDGFRGATDEQKWEVEQFRGDYGEDAFWIDECILQSDEDENKTHMRENITLIINEGAEFSIEYEDYTSNDWDSDYYMAFTPKFNGERVMLDGEVYFQDPYTYDELKVENILYENGAYIIQIPKEWWENEDSHDEILSEFKEAFEQAYRKSLIHNLGVFGIASNMYEEKLKKENDIKVFDQGHIQDFGNAWEDSYVDDEDLWVLYNITSEDVEKAVKDEWKEQEEYYEGYE